MLWNPTMKGPADAKDSIYCLFVCDGSDKNLVCAFRSIRELKSWLRKEHNVSFRSWDRHKDWWISGQFEVVKTKLV